MSTRLQWVAITVALVLAASSFAYQAGAARTPNYVTRAQFCEAVERLRITDNYTSEPDRLRIYIPYPWTCRTLLTKP